ncbi:MAG: hypothetical protein M3R38_27145, partial [Actinomycetota bacterium]|nr:hypothetical protein [Actinomycetota bacterium]
MTVQPLMDWDLFLPLLPDTRADNFLKILAIPSALLMLRSSKAVHISAWPNRPRRKEKDVPKLLRARLPEDADEER